MSDQTGVLLGCCSDTHGSSLPRWGEPGIAAVLHAGDVYDAPSLIEDDDDPAARHWAASAGVPVFAVRGNHDYLDPGGFFRAAQDVTGRLCRLGPGLWVAGVGFAPKRYYDLPGESDLEPQCRALARQASRQVLAQDKLILLTHYPPKLPELPCSDVPVSWTCDCVARLVEELQPIAVVQGHVHDWFAREWRRGATLIISPGPGGRLLCVSHAGDASAKELRISR